MLKITVPQPAATEFADYVAARKDDMLDRWVSGVANDERVPSSDSLNTKDLLDHLPQILDELCSFLRERDEVEALNKLHDDSETHGKERWQQGFTLKEILLEVDRFRKILVIDVLRDFAATRQESEAPALRELEHAVYDFYCELIVGSAVEYTESKEAQLRDYGRKLAATNEQLSRVNRSLRKEESKTRALSLSDPLTQVANRRHLEQQLAVEIERSRCYGEPLTVVMMDLDHFKEINDEHSHGIGDRVLKAVADNLRTHSRGSDFLARYGGEEFTLLLPATTLATAEILVERMRASMTGHLVAPLTRPVTGSFGIAQWTEGDDAAAVLHHADQAMYRAKASGRNRVSLYLEEYSAQQAS